MSTYDYDGADREWRVTDPEGGVMSRTFDAAGNVARVTDAEGRVTRTDYDNRNLAVATVAEGFVDDPVDPGTPRDVVMLQTAYDNARRKLTETDALGRLRRYGYDRADRLTTVVAEGYVTRSGTTRDVPLVSRTYDHAGHVVSETTGGTRAVTTAYDPAGRVVSTTLDPGGLNRTTAVNYDQAGNVVARTLSGGGRTEQTRAAYDDGGRQPVVPDPCQKHRQTTANPGSWRPPRRAAETASDLRFPAEPAGRRLARNRPRPA